ncbi:MAG: winged helix-turn-helix transcriptional regulator [Candidatus Hodarchaeales archaeon]|jgi:DNA-binding HxlR family transcriptional regulator
MQNFESVDKEIRTNLCPVRETLKIIGKKWHLLVLFYLTKGPVRFSPIKDDLEISSKVLAEVLNDLEDKGLINKEIVEMNPTRAEYSLTEKGEELQELWDSLRDWGLRWAICLPEDKNNRAL